MSQVFVKAYPAPPVNIREVLRYAGVRESTPEVNALLHACLEQVQGKLRYHVCWAMFPLSFQQQALDLGFAKTTSRDLRNNLRECTQVLLFAATVGMEMDRIVTRASCLSAAQGHMLQAIGAERIESLCDAFNAEVSKVYRTCPRFSPGYGDFPLALQKDIFRALNCTRTIGLSLSANLLMNPTKSVTALIGVKGENA